MLFNLKRVKGIEFTSFNAKAFSVLMLFMSTKSFEMNKHVFKIVSPLGSHIILCFSVPNVMAIFRREIPKGVSNADGVGRNRDSEPIFGSIACCERQVQYTQP